MKYEMKESGKIKMVLTREEFDLLFHLMTHVRLGGSKPLSKLATQILEAGENFCGATLYEEVSPIGFTAEFSPAHNSNLYNLDVIIEQK